MDRCPLVTAATSIPTVSTRTVRNGSVRAHARRRSLTTAACRRGPIARGPSVLYPARPPRRRPPVLYNHITVKRSGTHRPGVAHDHPRSRVPSSYSSRARGDVAGAGGPVRRAAFESARTQGSGLARLDTTPESGRGGRPPRCGPPSPERVRHPSSTRHRIGVDYEEGTPDGRGRDSPPLSTGAYRVTGGGCRSARGAEPATGRTVVHERLVS